MNLVRSISYRYLVGKKSSQAIHWITGISVLGISVGSAALILVLSVFNGFEELLSGLFSKYNPDLKIVAREGKSFEEDSLKLIRLRGIKEVQFMARTLEEVAMFHYGDSYEFGLIKGVDPGFESVCNAADAVLEGQFNISKEGTPLANIGLGLRNKLGVDLHDFTRTLDVFVPNHKEEIIPGENLKQYPLQVQSVYTFRQDADYSTVITDLEAVREILKRPAALSSFEIKLKTGVTESNVTREIQNILGDDFIVKNRYQQDEAFLKIMKLEKWLYYALFCLTLLLVSFTVIGALWMIVLDKRMDISILKSMGMLDKDLKLVFLQLGLMICFLGMLLGSVVALSFYYLQKKFGLIGVPEEFITDSYPIQIRLTDFFIVGSTVFLIGCLAALLPIRKISEILPVFREE